MGWGLLSRQKSQHEAARKYRDRDSPECYRWRPEPVRTFLSAIYRSYPPVLTVVRPPSSSAWHCAPPTSRQPSWVHSQTQATRKANSCVFAAQRPNHRRVSRLCSWCFLVRLIAWPGLRSRNASQSKWETLQEDLVPMRYDTAVTLGVFLARKELDPTAILRRLLDVAQVILGTKESKSSLQSPSLDSHCLNRPHAKHTKCRPEYIQRRLSFLVQLQGPLVSFQHASLPRWEVASKIEKQPPSPTSFTPP